MVRFVTLLGFAALAMAVFAANAASREPLLLIPTGDDSRKTNDQTSKRLPVLQAVLPFHAPFSLN